MDLDKLTTADKIIVGSGILLFIAYFLPWFKVDFGEFGGSVSASGSDVGFLWSTLPMLIGLVMAGVIVASKLFDAKLPDAPWPTIHLALGALAALLVILKLIIGEDPSDVIERAFGLFLATLAAIGLAVGGFLKFQGKEDPNITSGGNTGTAPF